MKNYYRKDIQGLRAIAVLMVYAAHSGVETLSGGFVGVDVFFVISGYVITQSLLNEYAHSRDVQIVKFYARRFIRLIPALFFVLIISNFLSILLLAPFEQNHNYPSFNYAIVWLSNFFFLSSEGGYFDLSSSEYLYLHTWSLGVEEQFYLIWPLLILFGLGYFKKNKSTSNVNDVAKVIVISGLISFALSSLLVLASDNTRAFYLMPARAWQFALGAYIATKRFNNSALNFNGRFSSIFLRSTTLLPVLGLVLLIMSAVLFNDNVEYPSWRSVIPSLGVTLLLLAQRNDNNPTFIGKFLANPLLVWVGTLSYSVYLWHWPVLYFQSKIDQSISIGDSIITFLCVIFLALVTYYLIENPLRTKLKNVSPVKIFALFATATALMLCMSHLSKLYTSKHINNPDQQQIMANRSNMASANIYASGCDSWISSSALVPCVLPLPPEKDSSRKEVYLVGDSVAAQWFEEIGIELVKQNWKVTILTKSSCPMVDSSFFYQRIKATFEICDKWRENVLQLIAKTKPSMIILGSSSTYPFTENEWLSGSTRLLNRVANIVDKVVLLGGSGGLGFDGPRCLARESWWETILPISKPNSCYRKWVEPKSLTLIKQASYNFDNVKYIDFNDLICTDTCYAKRNQIVTFRDATHLSDAYIKALSPEAIKRLNKLILSF